MLRWLAAPLLALCACAAEPAPQDLDGLVHWFWRNYEAAGDEEVADAVNKLHTAAKAGELDGPVKGALTPLSEEEAALVEVKDRGEAKAAKGILLVNLIRCPLPQVEELFISLDQKAIHPGYDKYHREYTSDVASYKAREESLLTWKNEYTVSLIASTYDAKILGGSRFVPALPDGKSPHGPIVLSRIHLPERATFNNEDDYFIQDYQAQVFYERKPGEVVHIQAAWREIRFAGFDMDDDYFVNGTLDTFAKGDEERAAKCQ